jgi:ribonuclease HI
MGVLKINIDAGCFEEHFTCWGLIVRNHEGLVSAAATKRENVTMAPELAEPMGLSLCFQWIYLHNVQNVVIEMDAESVVNCVLEITKVASIDIVVTDCLELMFSMSNVSLIYVKRCNSRAAHRLVGIARNCGIMSWEGPLNPYHPLYFLISLIQHNNTR